MEQLRSQQNRPGVGSCISTVCEFVLVINNLANGRVRETTAGLLRRLSLDTHSHTDGHISCVCVCCVFSGCVPSMCLGRLWGGRRAVWCPSTARRTGPASG